MFVECLLIIFVTSTSHLWITVLLCDRQLLTLSSAFCPQCVLVCIWEQTAIISLYSIDWLVCITETECVYCAVRTGFLYIIQVMCFVWIWEQTAIVSLYSIDWLVCITETECVYCAVRTGFLYIIQVMCFVWIWEQTAIVSPNNMNWLAFTIQCVYCAGQNCIFI